MPDVAERFAAQGVDIVASTADEFAAFSRRDVARYAKLVKAANIRSD